MPLQYDWTGPHWHRNCQGFTSVVNFTSMIHMPLAERLLRCAVRNQNILRPDLKILIWIEYMRLGLQKVD
jgi:hypothetical protein